MPAYQIRSQDDEETDWVARRELFYSHNPEMRAIHAEESAMPRKVNMDAFVCTTSSVDEIESVVKQYVHKLLPRAVAVTCGSYRRGKGQSGDVDVLISDPTQDDCNILPRTVESCKPWLTCVQGWWPTSTRVAFSRVVDKHMRRAMTWVFVDDLTTMDEHHIGDSDSYMGVCRLREVGSRPRDIVKRTGRGQGMRHRRIDLKVYPRNLFGFAQLYFTGSDHFNRSMRAFAKTKVRTTVALVFTWLRRATA
ncbi:hypothetical protein DYB32_004294 [Aphanomyces invadans]|uniref:DNA polymerase n=1 Tax=Aphanomyces invadans TaxID=157072 RepID=A0A3R7AA10_9STRA|nr:hypothetical protein DYB32_004294 [Aphanomyces invadans]